MMGISLRCPVCSRLMATEFVGIQMTHKCKCGTKTSIILPARILDKEGTSVT
jgi:hypothetical protein